MRPVMQRYKNGSPDDEHPIGGDCFRAALCTILHLEIDDVPHFEHERTLNETLLGHDTPYGAFQLARQWLRKFGADLGYLHTPLDFDPPSTWFGLSNIESAGNNDLHVVVVNRQLLVAHDPYPLNAGEDLSPAFVDLMAVCAPYDPDPPTLTEQMVAGDVQELWVPVLLDPTVVGRGIKNELLEVSDE